MGIYLTLALIVSFGGFFAYYRLFEDKKKLIPRLFEACGYISTVAWLWALPTWLEDWGILLFITLPATAVIFLTYIVKLFLYSMQWLGTIGEAKGSAKQPAFRPHKSTEQKNNDE